MTLVLSKKIVRGEDTADARVQSSPAAARRPGQFGLLQRTT
jgi:hypothetical protein